MLALIDGRQKGWQDARIREPGPVPKKPGRLRQTGSPAHTGSPE
jgi:hypothetical protein